METRRKKSHVGQSTLYQRQKLKYFYQSHFQFHHDPHQHSQNLSIGYGHGSNSGYEFVELLVSDINILTGLWAHFPFIYKIGEQQSGNGPILLQQVCKERGWKEFSYLNTDSYGNALQGWNLHWVTGKLSSKNVFDWQVSNHANFYSNGNNYSFTMKNGCSRYLKRLQNSFGSTFDFGPLTFNLPSDYSRLCSEHSKRKKAFLSKLFSWEFEMSLQSQVREQTSSPEYCYMKRKDPPKDVIRPIWICKPVGKSRGRGIVIFDSPEKLNYMKHCVVQEYISRPYLIGGYKWDLRLYVCIVSRAPLVIYTYTEGLVRFSTCKFNLNHLSNIYSHLTNTSVNRESPEYLEVKTEIGKGCKWPLRKLRSFWKAHGIDDWYLWQRIWKIITLTIIGDTSNICKSDPLGVHFDLLGFDIIVDEDFKPYLLEVNSSPALTLDCDVDEIVKKPMLHDLFDLLGLPDANHFQNENTAYFEDSCFVNQGSYATEDNNSSDEACSVNTATEDNSSTYGNLSLKSAPHRLSLQNLHESRKDSRSNFAITSGSPGVAHLTGARNAFNEIMNLALKPTVRTKHQSAIPDNMLGTNNAFDYDSLLILQEKIMSHRSSGISFYRENNYFHTVGCPGKMQIHPPLHVKIPIRKRPCRVRHPRNYLDKWRSGMMYKMRDWSKGHYMSISDTSTNNAFSPDQVGGWIRTYPFDHTTYSLSCSPKNFDIRIAIQHVSNYMKTAKDVTSEKGIERLQSGRKCSLNFVSYSASNLPSKDYYYDQMLSKIMQMNTKVWHPEFSINASAASD